MHPVLDAPVPAPPAQQVRRPRPLRPRAGDGVLDLPRLFPVTPGHPLQAADLPDVRPVQVAVEPRRRPDQPDLDPPAVTPRRPGGVVLLVPAPLLIGGKRPARRPTRRRA